MKRNITIGMDLGDQKNVVVAMDETGKEIETKTIRNTELSLRKFFSRYCDATVAIEAGTHSPWISRLLKEIGCTVYVGNPRKLRIIWDSNDKSDLRDARILAMVCRVEPRLLWPIKHRDRQAYADLGIIKARDTLVQNRVRMINHIRSVTKTSGSRIPKCSTPSFSKRAPDYIPKELRGPLDPLITTIDHLTQQIKEMDRQINKLCKKYSETEKLLQVPGVDPITALAFVLTIEDPHRFTKSRQVGAFLGLTPKRDQSGKCDKQLRISKAGNTYLRSLLVSCGHYIIGPFGPECDLRAFGLSIVLRGGKNAKKRAAVALARKLAVLLHRLWISDQKYNCFYSDVANTAA
nr:IS110 family transposase [uncultured Desulfobacter sp.]